MSMSEPGDEPGPGTAELLIRDHRGIGDHDAVEITEDGTWIVVNESGEVTNQFWISPHPAGGLMSTQREYCPSPGEE